MRNISIIIFVVLMLAISIASAQNIATVTGDDGYGMSVSAEAGSPDVSLLPTPSVELAVVANRTEAHLNETVEYTYTITAGLASLHNLTLYDSYGSVDLPSQDLAAESSMSVVVDRYFRS